MTGTIIYSIEGDTADKICQRYYGRTAGVTEQLLQHNRHLAALGPVLPTGTAIQLPEQAAPAKQPLIQLWN